MRPFVLVALLLGSAACGGEDLSGHTWALTLRGVDDGCTGEPVTYTEKLDYRVQIDGQDAILAIGPDEFATGTVNGCTLAYESVVWEEEVDGFVVRWQLTGGATFTFGDASCNPPNGTDWDGEERFEVTSTDNPAISPGCAYTIALSGKYTGRVK